MVSPLPSDAELKTLAKDVKKKFALAIEQGDAFFYPSDKIVLRGSDTTQVLWQIRTVPALLKKPTPNAIHTPSDGEEKKDRTGQNPKDVFAPPYVPNLLVRDLQDHALLLNKFCVVPQHFLLVTTEFESQELPPSPRTLTLAYKIIAAHKLNGHSASELLAFYNCGQLSGASQPHRHVQFVQCPPLDTSDVGDGDADSDESKRSISESDLERISDAEYKVPIEQLLDHIERDGKEHDAVHALPVPWQHFVVLLNPKPAMQKDSAQLEQYIAGKFMHLLDAMFRARMFGQDNSEEGARTAQRQRPSFNILLTKRAMHVVPRSQEDYTDLPNQKKGSSVGKLSINSLGYAGFMLTRSLEEQHELANLQGGVESVLATTGVAPVADVTVQGGLPTTNT